MLHYDDSYNHKKLDTGISDSPITRALGGEKIDTSKLKLPILTDFSVFNSILYFSKIATLLQENFCRHNIINLPVSQQTKIQYLIPQY